MRNSVINKSDIHMCNNVINTASLRDMNARLTNIHSYEPTSVKPSILKILVIYTSS